MNDLERVLIAVASLTKDSGMVAKWLLDPLDTFDGKTPLQLVEEGRAGDLLRYLASVESGFVG